MVRLSILFIALSVLSFAYNAQNTFIDGQGFLRETVFLPLGFIFLFVAIALYACKAFSFFRSWSKSNRPC